VSARNIVCSGTSLEQIRVALHEAPLVAIRQELTDDRILDACAESGHAWRERLYGPVTTVLHFVAQALQREASFAATWQELFDHFGAHFLMRKNARLIVERLPVIKRLGHRDFITEIPVSNQVRKKHPGMPPTVRVRIFRATWKSPDGRKLTEWFVTSLEDAQRFKPRTLAKLYHQRWRSETSYLEFKQTFHADVLRSKTVANIEKEFAAHVLAHQLVRLLMAQAARKHRKKPTELSTLNAARWLLSFSHQMATAPAARLPKLYHRLLDAIAGSEIDIRPGRLEPRAVTREWKHYPHLRICRPVWRYQQLQAGS
jgi:hypothetical protein